MIVHLHRTRHVLLMWYFRYFYLISIQFFLFDNKIMIRIFHFITVPVSMVAISCISIWYHAAEPNSWCLAFSVVTRRRSVDTCLRANDLHYDFNKYLPPEHSLFRFRARCKLDIKNHLIPTVDENAVKLNTVKLLHRAVTFGKSSANNKMNHIRNRYVWSY